MASWLDRQLSSHRNQLLTTAVVSGAAVAATILSIQAVRRKIRVDELKASIPNVDEHKLEVVRYLEVKSDSQNLTAAVQVPDLNDFASRSLSTREEQRAAELAIRAQNGDYDQGEHSTLVSIMSYC